MDAFVVYFGVFGEFIFKIFSCSSLEIGGDSRGWFAGLSLVWDHGRHFGVGRGHLGGLLDIGGLVFLVGGGGGHLGCNGERGAGRFLGSFLSWSSGSFFKVGVGGGVSRVVEAGSLSSGFWVIIISSVPTVRIEELFEPLDELKIILVLASG